jgi:hypothetical protein
MGFQTGNKYGKGRRKLAPNAPRADFAAFFARLDGLPKYKRALRKALEERTLPPTIELTILAYVLGKPPSDAPEAPPAPPQPTPATAMQSLALKLVALPPDQFAVAIAALFEHEQAHAHEPVAALPPHAGDGE